MGMADPAECAPLIQCPDFSHDRAHAHDDVIVEVEDAGGAAAEERAIEKIFAIGGEVVVAGAHAKTKRKSLNKKANANGKASKPTAPVAPKLPATAIPSAAATPNAP